MAHLNTLVKAVIGAGGLDEDNAFAARIMHNLNCGVVNNMSRAPPPPPPGP